MADRIDAAIEDDQLAAPHAVVDRRGAQSKRDQLPPLDDPILAGGEPRDLAAVPG